MTCISYDALGRLGDFGHNDADYSKGNSDHELLYHAYFFLESPEREAISVGEKSPAIYNLITSPEDLCFRVEAENASDRVVSSSVVHVNSNDLLAAIETRKPSPTLDDESQPQTFHRARSNTRRRENDPDKQ